MDSPLIRNQEVSPLGKLTGKTEAISGAHEGRVRASEGAEGWRCGVRQRCQAVVRSSVDRAGEDHPVVQVS